MIRQALLRFVVKHRCRTFWVAASLILLPYAGTAQKQPNFNRLSVGVAYALTFNKTALNDYYKAPQWLGIEMGTNYLHGFLKARVQYSGIVSKSSVPSYKSYHLSLGYDYQKQLPLNLCWTNGIAVGNAYMVFRPSATVTDNLNESELLLYLHSTIEWKVGKQFGLATGVEWTRIYTQIRIDFVNVKFQSNYYFNNHPLLKKWLQ